MRKCRGRYPRGKRQIKRCEGNESLERDVFFGNLNPAGRTVFVIVARGLPYVAGIINGQCANAFRSGSREALLPTGHNALEKQYPATDIFGMGVSPRLGDGYGAMSLHYFLALGVFFDFQFLGSHYSCGVGFASPIFTSNSLLSLALFTTSPQNSLLSFEVYGIPTRDTTALAKLASTMAIP